MVARGPGADAASGVAEATGGRMSLTRFIWKRWTRKPKLSWWVPRWSYVPKMQRDCRETFNAKAIVRVGLLSAIACGAIVAGCKIAFPLLNIDLLWKAVLALPAILAAFYVMQVVHYVVHYVVQPRANVCPDYIHMSHGEYYWIAKSDCIVATYVSIFAPDRIRLRVVYVRRGRRFSMSIGVDERVSLETLSQMLPVTPRIRDARERYARSCCRT